MTDQSSVTQTIEDLAREFGLSPAEFARRVTALRSEEVKERFRALGSLGYEEILKAANDLGIPIEAVRGMIGDTMSGGTLSFNADAFTETELAAARLTPPAIVENYLYRDLAVLAGPGGSNKTTLTLWEHIHPALDRPLYGFQTCPTRALFCSGEDSRERIGARLHAIMDAMGLNSDERAAVLDCIRVVDLTGHPFRLCVLDRNGNIRTSDDVSRLIDTFGPFEPGLIHFDPLASFGAPEQSLNDAAQGAVNAARRIIRELGCCVRIAHHTGQAGARENVRDQYAPRGGSALSDGARMVAVISRPSESEPLPFPVGPDDHVFVLSRAKCSYCPQQPDIYLKRTGFVFEHFVDVQRTDEEKRSEHANQIEAFLIDQLKVKRYHSKNTLEALANDLKMPRKELRAALNELLISGRLTEEELPDCRKQGGARLSYARQKPTSPVLKRTAAR
jgi:regulatory protein RepA